MQGFSFFFKFLIIGVYLVPFKFLSSSATASNQLDCLKICISGQLVKADRLELQTCYCASVWSLNLEQDRIWNLNPTCVMFAALAFLVAFASYLPISKLSKSVSKRCSESSAHKAPFPQSKHFTRPSPSLLQSLKELLLPWTSWFF